MAERSRRSDPDFGLSRRAFFPALFREVQVLSGSLKGGRSYALSELRDLPDDQLARLVPLILPVFAIYVDGERLVGRHAETGVVVELAPSVRENVLALNLFDGQITLGTAGRRLAQQMDWDEARGFAHVRDLFLSWVGRLVCVPRNSPEPEE